MKDEPITAADAAPYAHPDKPEPPNPQAFDKEYSKNGDVFDPTLVEWRAAGENGISEFIFSVKANLTPHQASREAFAALPEIIKALPAGVGEGVAAGYKKLRSVIGAWRTAKEKLQNERDALAARMRELDAREAKLEADENEVAAKQITVDTKLKTLESIVTLRVKAQTNPLRYEAGKQRQRADMAVHERDRLVMSLREVGEAMGFGERQ